MPLAVNGKQTVGDPQRCRIHRDVPLRADGPCGGTLSPRFAFEGREANDAPFAGVEIDSTEAERFDFQLGATMTAAYTVSNARAVAIHDLIPDSDPTKENGRADPYPSAIMVANVPNQTGRTGERVSHVAVTLNEVTHTYSADIAAVLVAPNGTKMALMRNAGGRVSGKHTSSERCDAHFRQRRSGKSPFCGSDQIGSLLPTDYGSGDLISGQVPTGLFLASLELLNGPHGRAATQADVDANNPNGEWKLAWVDTTQGDSGVIAGG